MSLMTCPYNNAHRVKFGRFHTHLLNCKKQHPELHLYTCLYNAYHLVKKEDRLDHLRNCPDARVTKKIIEHIPLKPSASLLGSDSLYEGQQDPQQKDELSFADQDHYEKVDEWLQSSASGIRTLKLNSSFEDTTDKESEAAQESPPTSKKGAESDAVSSTGKSPCIEEIVLAELYAPLKRSPSQPAPAISAPPRFLGGRYVQKPLRFERRDDDDASTCSSVNYLVDSSSASFKREPTATSSVKEEPNPLSMANLKAHTQEHEEEIDEPSIASRSVVSNMDAYSVASSESVMRARLVGRGRGVFINRSPSISSGSCLSGPSIRKEAMLSRSSRYQPSATTCDDFVSITDSSFAGDNDACSESARSDDSYVTTRGTCTARGSHQHRCEGVVVRVRDVGVGTDGHGLKGY